MMRRTLSIILTAAILIMAVPNVTVGAVSPNWQDTGVPVAVSPNGDGVYEIYTPEQLAWIAQKVNAPTGSSTFNSYTVKLMNDIDLSSREWTPIGGWNGTAKDTSKTFSGTLDGNDKTIIGVKIGTVAENNSTYDYVGLFGYGSGIIQKLGIENISIYSNKSNADVGGLMGFQYSGSITNSYVVGNITGIGNLAYVGGIVGYQNDGAIANSYVIGNVTGGSCSCVGGLTGAQDYGTISNSYVTGNVAGGYSSYTGGLIGRLARGTIIYSYATANITGGSGADAGGLIGFLCHGIIINTYATGNVTGVDSAKIGGLVGRQAEDNYDSSNFDNIIINSFWNRDAVHRISSVIIVDANKKGVGSGTDLSIFKESEELKSQAFVNLLNETNNIPYAEWVIDNNMMNQGYPIIKLVKPNPNKYWIENAVPIAEDNSTFSVYTPEHLAWISLQVSKGVTFEGKTIRLMNDIDLSGKEWTPIGGWNGVAKDFSKKFNGVFDGNGKKVYGVNIGTSSENNIIYTYVGFFGIISGKIQNTVIKDVLIYSNISNDFTGALAGYQYGGTITNSYATENINGGNGSTVGGLIGWQDYYTMITNSHATGNVVGGYYVGGLVGIQQYHAQITNSYATGNVIGIAPFFAANTRTGGSGSIVGGLVGYQYSAIITNSYAMGDVTGENSAGGLVGFQDVFAEITNSYATGDITGGSSVKIGGLVGGQYNATIISSYWNKDAIYVKGGVTVSATSKKGVGSGEDTSTGKMLSELKQQATFINWDFVDFWAVDGTSVINDGMPYLKSNAPPHVAPTYTVTYNATDSTGGAVPTDNGNYSEGDTVTVLDNTNSLTKTGFTFAGWNTVADGSGTSYTANSSLIMGNANVVLYAKWADSSEFGFGDVNTDGVIDITDVIIAAEIAVAPAPYPSDQILRANVDSKTDTTVDISDVILIAERAVDGKVIFPVEQ